MNSVNWEFVLRTSAILRRPCAASVRGLFALLGRELGSAWTPESTARFVARHRDAPAKDDASAGRRLAARDLAMIATATGPIASRLVAWSSPSSAAAAALHDLTAALDTLGIAIEPPELHLVESLPGPYASPGLSAVSIDAADAAESTVPAGVYLRRDRLAPWTTEATLGHVLVHTALGQRSPRLLGRGLEEGLAEILGGLLACGNRIGDDAADACFLARHDIVAMSPARRALLAATRAGARLLRSGGIAALVAAVNGGREALKVLEADLAQPPPVSRPPIEPPASGADNRSLDARLEYLLGRPQPPLAVPPMVFAVAREVTPGRHLDAIASAIGAATRVAGRALAELARRTHLAVVDGTGTVVAEDVQLLIAAGALRYRA